MHEEISRKHSMAGQPDLDIVGLGGRKTEIAARKGDHTIVQTEPLENRLGVTGQFLEPFGRVIRVHELDEFDLVELVLADEAPHIAPVRPGLGPKTRCEGAVAKRQDLFVEGLVAVDIGHRDLGGGRQVEIQPFKAEKIVGEFRKLAGADQGRGVDEIWRDHLGVAVALSVEIQHVGDQGPLECRAVPAKDRKPARRDLRGAFEIYDPEVRSEVPVG